VAHFGDVQGARAPCGICDFCDPQAVEAQAVREATAVEDEIGHEVLAALKGRDGQSAGKLHEQVCGSGLRMKASRDHFEQLLRAMAAAGWLDVREDSFQADGREIRFRRVSLTHEGRTAKPDEDLQLHLREEIVAETKKRQKRSSATAKTSARKSARKSAKKGSSPRQPDSGALALASEASGNPLLAEALRAWRLAEAKRRGVPAFRIFSDKALEGLLLSRPDDEEGLLMVAGLGPAFVRRHGTALLKVLRGRL